MTEPGSVRAAMIFMWPAQVGQIVTHGAAPSRSGMRDAAALDHHPDVGLFRQAGDVVGRIAVDGDQVGDLARFDCAQIVEQSECVGGGSRGGGDGFERRQAAANVLGASGNTDYERNFDAFG